MLQVPVVQVLVGQSVDNKVAVEVVTGSQATSSAHGPENKVAVVVIVTEETGYG